MTVAPRALVLLCLMVAALLMPGCDKNSGTTEASFQPLGDQLVNELTGFGSNGDPLARAVNGEMLRYRQSTGNWERVGASPSPSRLSPRSEDALGNVYADSPGPENWWLPAGTPTWMRLVLPDSDVDTKDFRTSVVFSNNAGDVVTQTHRTKGGVDHVRVYRKLAASTAWKLASDRALDFFNITGLADNGDVFLVNKSVPGEGPKVLKASSSTLESVSDCGGAIILPYCALGALSNSAGAIVFYGGGANRHMYRINPGVTYPVAAEAVFDMPADVCCFNGGTAYLADGTIAARMNQGGYDPHFLYVRRPDADGWSQTTLPQDDGGHSVDIRANGKGDLFTWSIPLGAPENGAGVVYRVRL